MCSICAICVLYIYYNVLCFSPAQRAERGRQRARDACRRVESAHVALPTRNQRRAWCARRRAARITATAPHKAAITPSGSLSGAGLRDLPGPTSLSYGCNQQYDKYRVGLNQPYSIWCFGRSSVSASKDPASQLGSRASASGHPQTPNLEDPVKPMGSGRLTRASSLETAARCYHQLVNQHIVRVSHYAHSSGTRQWPIRPSASSTDG